MKDYSALKSGTDVRGFASGHLGNMINLTEEAVRDISASFVMFVAKKLGKDICDLKISVGHDSRITADVIMENVISSVTKLGATVINCGLSSTPAMFMTTVDIGVDGAIQITASHHPADRNGLKFFTRSGGLEGEEIKQIIEAANTIEIVEAEKCGEVIHRDFMSEYAANLRKIICNELSVSEEDKPLKDYHIVVDAGNGVGGFYATEVLEKLGADISGSVYLDPDGNFPNHIPNPEDVIAMASISQAVIDANADLGVIFDTDVDRAACVDSDGIEINRNKLIALAAAIALEGKSGTIVTDSVTSDGLKEFIEKDLGGKHHRFKRGYKNVINEAIRLCENGEEAPLAIETSGHAALKENYFLDDGAYLMTKIIIKMAKLGKEGKTIGDLISSLKTPLEEKEFRLDILVDEFRSYGECVIEGIQRFCETDPIFKIADDNHEGIRVSVGDIGWFLVRLSVHDPIMPMNCESTEFGGVKKILNYIAPLLFNCRFLDTSSIKHYIETAKDELFETF